MTESIDNPPPAGPSLAQVDPPQGLAKPALRILLAAIITSLAIGAYIRFEHKPPTATGEVARISIYPVHTQIHGAFAGAPGMAGQDENYDQLLVFAHVRLHNQNTTPLTIDDDWAVVTLPNGESRRSLGESSGDFNKVFSAYPQLAPLRMDPLRRDIQIQPGQSVDGLVIFNYPLTREQWENRKSMAVTVSFANANEVILRAPQN